MGAQESVLKSLIVGLIPSERRSTAFGVFDTGFGIAWFLGSAFGVRASANYLLLGTPLIVFMYLRLDLVPVLVTAIALVLFAFIFVLQAIAP